MEFKTIHDIQLEDLIFDTRFHPNNQNDLFAAATINGNIHLYESGEQVSRLKKHHKGSPIRKVRFFKDGRLVSIAKTIKVHDLVSNETTLTIRNEECKTTFYSVRPFGANVICAGDDDGRISVWDTRTPEQPVFASQDCDQYISDIDGKYESRRLIVCTSGEGTLTAYDLRANKMIEPQSELFEAGFQCVKLVDVNKKVVIGGEDGAIYVFNQNEWGHTSGKFALSSDAMNRGKCSVDCLDLLQDNNTFLAGGSDGKMRVLTLWPHKVISEKYFCKKSSLESLQVNPNDEKSNFIISGENYINIVEYEEKSDVESDDEDDESCSENSSAVSTDKSDSEQKTNESEPQQKKAKTNTDDYLNVFH